MNNFLYIKHHPNASYIILTLLWSWTMWSFLFFFITPGGLLKSPPPVAYIFVLLGGIGPSLIGLLLTRYVYGKIGVQKIVARLKYGESVHGG